MNDKDYAHFFRTGLSDSPDLETVKSLADKVRALLATDAVKDEIAKVHLHGASSHKVQAAIIKEVEALGFQSEKRVSSKISMSLESDPIITRNCLGEESSSKSNAGRPSQTTWIYSMFGRLTSALKPSTCF